MVPIGIALSATAFFTLVNLISRYFILKGSITSKQQIADGFIIQGTIYVILLLALPKTISLFTFLAVGGLSLIGTIGNVLINEAIVHGKGGPASALGEIQSLVILVLEIFCKGQIPNNLQIAGFVLGLTGGLFIIFEGAPRQHS